MLCLFLLASTPVPPMQDEARHVVEAQLRSPPREPGSTGLSAEEAAIVRTRYLQSIGQRPPRPSDQDGVAGQ
ncbi:MULTISPECIES: hypothetical protein [Sphingobium]|uniref:hypothetical protein n=1 Tax=Sphingobium sp. MI1205 TaxID=407020 RepID=UPI0007705F06|nr:hypothetical protein [Sphingobium sp. MI1205]AMK20061.1 hypothetical protein K663_18501 [Sphingobium sp. MI1205]